MSWVIGNWKMNGSRAANAELVQAILNRFETSDSVKVAVCPPSPYLEQVGALLSGSEVQLGAQDISASQSGAYTGDVSGAMLKEFGVSLVLIGHSERRTLHGETDAQVADKVAAALAAGLTPVLCIGETLTEREQEQTLAVIERQVQRVIERIGIAALADCIIAYEPVWAIGTGLTATPEEAQAVHAFIRERIAALDSGVAGKVDILYGGSVKPDNAEALFGQPDIDGGLIGGASLDATAFVQICQAAG